MKTWSLILLLNILLFAATPPNKIVLLGNHPAEPEMILQKQTSNDFLLSIRIPVLYRNTVLAGNKEWDVITLGSQLTRSAEEGKPALPVFRRWFRVPENGEIQVQVLEADYQKIEGIDLLPVQPEPVAGNSSEINEFVQDQTVYQQNQFYPHQQFSIGEVQIIRHQALQLVSVYPVQFNPVSKELKVATHFRLNISISGPDGQTTHERYWSPAIERMLKRIAVNRLSYPPASLKKSANLLDQSDVIGCDYLIITPQEFKQAADSLAAWRRLTGYRTRVVTLNQIGQSADEIRSFLQQAYDSWDVVPEFVLLLGDAEFIPTNYKTQHPSADEGEGIIGTDLYYFTLDGADLFADIAYGRISVDTPLQAMQIVRKIINYERQPVTDPSFYQRVAMVAYFQDDDDPDTDYNERDGYEDRRFILTSEEMRDFLKSKGYDAFRIYYAEPEVTPLYYNNGSYASGEPLPADLLRENGFLWDGDANQITEAIEQGCFFVSHRDHGNRGGWGDPRYRSSHVSALENGERLPIVFSINCQTGWFDNETDQGACGTDPSSPCYVSNTGFDEECFAEYWFRNFKGGAVGVFGDTRISYSGYNDVLVKGFWDAIWPDFLNYGSDQSLLRPGLILLYGKLYMAQVYSGGSKTGIQLEEFHYFGDPATPIRIEAPQPITFNENLNLWLNQTTLHLSLPVAQANVALVQNGRLLAKTISDEHGQADLEFNPIHEMEPVQLCATHPKHIPLIRNLQVFVPDSLALIINSVEIVNGEDREVAHPGDSLQLKLGLQNNDNTDWENLELTLHGGDEFLTINNNLLKIDRLEKNQQLNVQGFSLKVAKDAPCPHLESLKINVQDGIGRSLEAPFNLPIEQGRPHLAFEPYLVSATASEAGHSVTDSLILRNEGSGKLSYFLNSLGKQFIQIGDSTQLKWDNVPKGIGNILKIESPSNLLHFSTYMKLQGAGRVYFFVYEGTALKGNYNLVASKSKAFASDFQGYLWSPNLNIPLKQNHYYYLGVSWEGTAAVCRSTETAPLQLNIGSLETGCANLGGIPPEATVNQVISKITPYVQQIETGQGDWLSGLPKEGTLLPGEEDVVLLEFKADQTDTLFYSPLILKSDVADMDSVMIPVYFAVGDPNRSLIAEASHLKEEWPDNAFNPGEEVQIPLVVRNLKNETLPLIEGRLLSEDHYVSFQDSLVRYEQVEPGAVRSDRSFKMKINANCPLHHMVIYQVVLNQSDTLTYKCEVRAGQPKLVVEQDSLKFQLQNQGDSLIANLTVRNEGYGTLEFHLENGVQHEVNGGTPKDGSWWPRGDGFGNIYYTVLGERLQAMRHYVKVEAPTHFYFYLYEADELKGTYTLRLQRELDVQETGTFWLQSPAFDVKLQAGRYYYLGLSWQGTASVLMASEKVTYETELGPVFSSVYNIGGALPQSQIEISKVVSYPVAQRLLLGQGLWIKCQTERQALLPGQSRQLSLTLFATHSDTVFKGNLTLVAENDDQERLKIPVVVEVTGGTAIGGKKDLLPQSLKLYQNYPNPFNGTTVVRFDLPTAQEVKLEIYNLLGQKVTTLIRKNLPAGHYRINWNGRNDNGNEVATGIYFMVLRTEARSLKKKVLFIK